jgi:hypothetical protein
MEAEKDAVSFADGEPIVLVPHPDDEAEVRAGLEEAARGEVLSAEGSLAYVEALLGDDERADR